MHCPKALIALLAVSAFGAEFSGTQALDYTRQAVAFGQRPAGSPANRQLQAFIEAQLKPLRCQTTFDAFTASTPVGTVPMRNIIARFPGTSGRAVVLTGHFDSKPIPGVNFLGANDGGASTGLLLEMARALNSTTHANEIVLVFFDGEEAFGEWSDSNGVYGSRHLAKKWYEDGTLARIKALINVDMIGDKNLDLLYDENSSPSLRSLVWQTANDMGYQKYFLPSGFPIDDDHMPFIRLGVSALDLIDFDYGPNNAYWHTAQDTLDKISAHSLEVVGNVLVAVLRKLEP